MAEVSLETQRQSVSDAELSEAESDKGLLVPLPVLYPYLDGNKTADASVFLKFIWNVWQILKKLHIQCKYSYFQNVLQLPPLFCFF